MPHKNLVERRLLRVMKLAHFAAYYTTHADTPASRLEVLTAVHRIDEVMESVRLLVEARTGSIGE